MLVPTSVTTRLTSRFAVSLPTVGLPSHSTRPALHRYSGYESLSPPPDGSCVQPNERTPIRGTCRLRCPDQALASRIPSEEGLSASQDFPVDELPECRVDPRLHLGFLPVLPEPSLLEGVLRPLEPAGPIVVAQYAALSHVVGVGTEEHHIECEGNLGAEVGDRGIVVEDPYELGLFHEDLAHPMELLIEIVHDARLGIGRERLDLFAREVHGDDDGHDDRDGLDEGEELGEPDVDHAV